MYTHTLIYMILENTFQKMLLIIINNLRIQYKWKNINKTKQKNHKKPNQTKQKTKPTKHSEQNPHTKPPNKQTKRALLTSDA